MPRPEIVKHTFQPFRGQHAASNRFTRPIEFAEYVQNMEFRRTSTGLRLEKRKGNGLVFNNRDDIHAGFADFGPSASGLNYQAYRIGEYVRVNQSTRAKESEIMLMDEHLWRVINKGFSLTSSSGTGSIGATYDSGFHRVTLTHTVDGTFTYNLNAGNPFSFPYVGYTIGDLIDDIDGDTSNVTITCVLPGTRVYIDGNQTNANSLVVDDGAGGATDVLVGMNLKIPLSGGGFTHRRITDVAANGKTIYFEGSTSLTVLDNAEVRPSLWDYPATVIGFGTSTGFTTLTSAGFPLYEAEQIPYWTDSVYHPFTDTVDNIDRSERGEWIPPAWENAKNCFFIGSAFETRNLGMLQYDGQNVFTAGMPQGALTSVAAAGSGTGVDAGDHDYLVTFEFKDAQGNIIEGKPSARTSVTLGSAEDVTVTINVDGITNASKFFLNTRAHVAGAQNGVTDITVDDGSASYHNIRPGDTVYFYDGVTGGYVERTVEAAQYSSSGGQISISGAAVNVADNARISANLKVNIYRSKVGGTEVYLVDTIPIGTYASTIAYTDSTADSALGAKFIQPESNVEHGLLENSPGAIRLFQGSMVVGGFNNDPDTFKYSVPGQPWYFPSTASAEIGEQANDIITGIGVSGEFLCIGKRFGIHRVSGQLIDPFTTQPAWRQEQISFGQGFVSHGSLVTIGNDLLFPSADNFYRIRNGLLRTQVSANKLHTSLLKLELASLVQQLRRDQGFALQWVDIIQSESSLFGILLLGQRLLVIERCQLLLCIIRS